MKIIQNIAEDDLPHINLEYFIVQIISYSIFLKCEKRNHPEAI